MVPIEVAGLIFVLTGVAVGGGAGWALRAGLAHRRRQFQVVAGRFALPYSDECVLRPVTSGSAAVDFVMLAPDGLPFAVNLGDVLWVYPDPKFAHLVRLYRSDQVVHSAALAVAGMVLGGTGVVALCGGDPFLLGTTGEAIMFPLFASFCLCAGIMGVVLAWLLVRGWQGSRRVTGRVVAVNVVPTSSKNTYQPLVEYPTDYGTLRRVWGTPRWFRPKLEYPATVRVSGRAPHEAVRTTPLVLWGQLLCFIFGLVGLRMLAAVLPG